MVSQLRNTTTNILYFTTKKIYLITFRWLINFLSLQADEHFLGGPCQIS